MAPKQDRRKERTEKEILNGLIALMQEKSMKNISVRELAERIDINRSTFYLHYTDIYDLIEKTENRLVEQILSVLPEESGFQERQFFDFLERLVTILKENQALCNVLMSPNGDIAFMDKIQQFMWDRALAMLAHMVPPMLERKDLEYATSFYINGCLGLISSWLQAGCQGSATHMAELAFILLRSGVAGLE